MTQKAVIDSDGDVYHEKCLKGLEVEKGASPLSTVPYTGEETDCAACGELVLVDEVEPLESDEADDDDEEQEDEDDSDENK